MNSPCWRVVSATALSMIVAENAHSQLGPRDPGPGQAGAKEVAKLTAEDAAPRDYFGSSVSLTSDTALVGSVGDEDNGWRSGSAYVWVRDGTTWTGQAKLTASDGAPGHSFGSSVSQADGIALVGAPDNDDGSTPGAAYVFVRGGTRWSEQAKLVPSDGEFGDRFGDSVSLFGETALIGAYLDDDKDTGSGSAYVFARHGTTWSETAKLTASDGTGFDLFGDAVSLSLETALVGAPRNDDHGLNSGSAYIFARRGTRWVEEAKLTASDASLWDEFGTSVSLSGDSALVGAHFGPGHGPTTGAAYVFVRDGTAWTEQAKLTASTAKSYRFGFSVSLSDDTALVGTPLDMHAGFVSGSAFLFERSGTSWSSALKLTAKDAGKENSFGSSVAIAGGAACIGAPGDNDHGQGAGSSYVFSLVAEPTAYCTAKTNSAGCVPEIGFVGCPSASATSGFAVVATKMLREKAGLLVYGISGSGSIPFQGGLLCLMPPHFRTPARSSMGNRRQACSGRYRLDMNAFAAGLAGGTPRPELRIPGTRVHCQWWARDAGDLHRSSLSDALEYVVGQ